MQYDKTDADLEREFALAHALNLPDTQMRRFVRGCFSSTHKIFPGKYLTLFAARDGGLQQVGRFVATAADFDLEAGITFTLRGLNKTWHIGHTPVEVAENVFVWAPKFATVERYLFQGQYVSRMTICVRSLHNPNTHVIDGTYYLTDERVYLNLTKG
jgi:hypothetical protein